MILICKNFIQFNPNIQLKKGTKAKKVDMDKLVPFTRKITGYIEADFTGGSKFINGDTLLARITPCLENGKTAYVNVLEDKEVGFGSTEFIVLRAIEGISIPLFIYYLAVSPDFREIAIASMSGTSGRQRVDVKALEQLEINLPPLEEQKRIAEVLGAFDDKIELLQKQNKTLEDMAKAIFKSWFVNFDVVKAKQRGDSKADIMREYHLTEELYDLFPSSFADSSLGPIPSGWEVKKLGEFISFIKGKKPKTISAKPVEGFLPQVLIETLDTGKFLFADPNKNILVESNDLIMVMDGASSGRLARGMYGVLGSTLSKIEVNLLTKSYVYYFLKRFEKNIQENTTGTSIPHTDKNRVMNFDIIEADKKLLNIFNLLVEDMFRKQILNKKQIQILTELRDSLLPRLISGKIRV